MLSYLDNHYYVTSNFEADGEGDLLLTVRSPNFGDVGGDLRLSGEAPH